MTHRLFVSTVLSVMLAAVSVTTQGCDPERATLDLFRRQGLNLVKPARDYIQVGGLIVKGERLDYIDPFGVPAGSPGGGSLFTATILAEARRGTAAFNLALNLIRGLLPGTADVVGESTRHLTLDQINATGKRLTYQEIESLLSHPATAAAIRKQLQNKHPVYIVQEVYSAEEVQVSASDRRAIKVSYGDGSDVKDCETTAQPGTAKTEEEKGSRKAEAQQGQAQGGEEKAPAGKPGAASTAGATTGAGQAGESGTSAKKNAVQGPPAGGKDQGDSKPSVTFGLCRAGTYSLKFKSVTPGQFMPFAVRLRQVEIRDGQLALKPGQAPAGGTLGREQDGYNLISDQRPEIVDLQRGSK